MKRMKRASRAAGASALDNGAGHHPSHAESVGDAPAPSPESMRTFGRGLLPYYSVNSIGYTLRHEEGSDERFVELDGVQVFNDTFFQ